MKRVSPERDAVLRLANRRWPTTTPNDIGALVRRAAKATGLSCSLADYLRTLARRHDMIARVLRLAARAADGADIDELVNEPIHEDAPR